MEKDNLPPLLLIDKPRGISSFTVIRKLRTITGVRKFGHAGTLDPLATGLMLIGVNKGTKLLTELIGLDKDYSASVLLGEKRTTGDLEGEILEELDYFDNLSEEEITVAVLSLVGDNLLPVSAYSAIKKAGVPMYKRARAAAKKGEQVAEVPLRTMQVQAATLCSISKICVNDKPRLLLSINFSVGSGTYIRSLAEALGERLGYPATLYALRRTRIGSYELKNALTLEDVSRLINN